MKLPDQLAEAFRKQTRHDPQMIARALYDLHGNLGATYVAADDDWVAFYSRPSGGGDLSVLLRWPEIQQATARGDGVFAFLECATAQGPFVLRFSAWDKPVLDSFVELWRKRGPAQESPGPERSASSEGPGAPSSPGLAATPLVAFCAGLHAMMECDQQVDPAELHFLASRIPDADIIRQGREFLQREGLDRVCECAGAVLNGARRRCLMANLISVAMVDGLLRSAESDLLNRFQAALGIADAEGQAMLDLLMTKNNLTVFPTTDVAAANLPATDGLTPLVAFCAAMLEMIAADDEAGAGEMEALTLAVPYPNDIRLGQEFLHAYPLDHLLERLGSVLDLPQQRCLMANLIALAMLNGVIRSSEQALLARFKAAMHFAEDDYAALYEVLLAKDNLAVFAV